MTPPSPRRIAVVTGSRAEFGLLRPVMRAVHAHPELELIIIAAGSHLASAGETYRDVKMFARELHTEVADAVPMQVDGRTGRHADAEAVGAGVSRFTRAFIRTRPDWVFVLGDRIEAFAAAASASIGGWALAHAHGGDRAEGVADEAMRHAITKLAHLHLPATAESADRIIRMGEAADRVHTIGSPAIDGLESIGELDDSAMAELGLPGPEPFAVFMMHPVGRSADEERAGAAAVLEVLREVYGPRVLAMHPNLDPGREGIMAAIESSGREGGGPPAVSHLPRDRFIGLLRRLARPPEGVRAGVLVGNSSAGLIEAAALRVRAVDIGLRQAGRERARNVVHTGGMEAESIRAAIEQASGLDLSGLTHPYGDGRTGDRAAEVLARLNPHDRGFLRKRCTY
ncbi:MAG: UDP-N-acetylglucosamine 2-epimerase (hydrolyzing) [Phycisphaerales bacterium]|nr:UDP-N-acetylglucosamine 2-epimerase (hydrolyzing) [Phycisphaerales bacterium]